MDVSVIIVNYHTTDLIIDCLNSIFRHSKDISFEIIIVDNASELDFDVKIKSNFQSFNRFEFIHLPINIGFGKANNEGIKIAKGRNIFFLNPDTVLLNNAIFTLSEFLDTHPYAGACGGNLFSKDLKPSFSFKRLLPGLRWELNELFNLIPLKLTYGRRIVFETKDTFSKVGYITGADLMVKKEVIDLVGGFNPDFFMYYEETDLCARIKKRGWKIYCVPQAHIQHLEGQSFDSGNPVNPTKIEWIEESRATYYRHNTAGIRKYIASLIYGIFLFSRKFLVCNNTKKLYYNIRYDCYKKCNHK